MALAHRREITSVFKGQAKGNRGLSAVSYDLINTQDRKESEEKRWRQDRVTHTHKCTVLLWKRAKEWAGLDWSVYIVLSGSVTNPEGRGRGEREDRRDGWMDRGKEEWRAGGLLCSSNNGNSGNAHPERLHIRVLESCCKLLLCNSDHHFIILLLMKICF